VAIICGTLLYGTFYPASNSSTPGSIGHQNNVILHNEIEQLRVQIAQMVAETNAQKTVEKLQNKTIAGLRVKIEKQAKEVSRVALSGEK
jgi:hypothetical protein